MKYLPITNNEIFADYKLLNTNEKQEKQQKERNRNHKAQTLKNVYFCVFLIFYRHRWITIEQKQEKETRNNYLLIFVRDRNRNIRKFNERNNKYIFFASFINNSSSNSKNIFDHPDKNLTL